MKIFEIIFYIYVKCEILYIIHGILFIYIYTYYKKRFIIILYEMNNIRSYHVFKYFIHPHIIICIILYYIHIII